MPRLGEVWPGKNRFYCGYRCVGGPDRGTLIATHLMLLIPGALFFAFPAADLASRTNPACLVVPLAVYLFTFLSLLRTSMTDPGIVPRYTGPDPEYAFDPSNPHRPRSRDVLINGQRTLQKWCDTCRVYRPPRATHCSICDCCVARMDHHCPWVGNCVGQRNYRWFYAFVVGVTAMCLAVFAMSVADLAVIAAERDGGGEARGFGGAVKEMPVALLLAIFTFLMFWSVAGLSGYHTYLVCTNQTTNEQIKSSYGVTERPYSRSCPKNCASVLCGPVPDSHFDFRADAEAQSAAFANRIAPTDIDYTVVEEHPLSDAEVEVAMISYDPRHGVAGSPSIGRAKGNRGGEIGDPGDVRIEMGDAGSNIGSAGNGGGGENGLNPEQEPLRPGHSGRGRHVQRQQQQQQQQQHRPHGRRWRGRRTPPRLVGGNFEDSDTSDSQASTATPSSSGSSSTSPSRSSRNNIAAQNEEKRPLTPQG